CPRCRAANSATPSPSTSSRPSGRASLAVNLACYACKGRKVKCDRQRPVCGLCLKLNAICEYPTHPEKPGPKTGESIRSLQRAKRRKLDHPPGLRGSTARDSTAPLPTGGHVDFVDSARPPSQSAVSPTAQDGALPRDPVSVSEGGPAAPSSPAGQESAESHPTSAPIFSRIMYPSHGAQTRPQSPTNVDITRGPRDRVAGGISVQSVCDALGISEALYDVLMESYFTNMTSFSLFKPGSIEPKFAMMQNHSDAEALVAAMFSFSCRHCQDRDGCPSPPEFASIASSKLDESVDRYGDMPPPFWLLQAGVLVTWYQLTMRVRSRSWKKLGDCIRYSYDTNLHLVDANHDATSAANRGAVNIQRWSLLEERRRVWWAVWEMDVFASTIRRLPTAIDASLNLTMLPVADSCWFNDQYQESCFLVEDCNLRWKHLAKSGNKSAKAWFIVVNSLMRNTQRIVYPASSVMQSLRHNAETNHDDELNIIANCLYCTSASLPACLVYQGETLDFRPKPSSDQGQDPSTNPRQEHADKYALHIMTQLCRFMIYHHKICTRTPWIAHHQQNQQQRQLEPPGRDASDKDEPRAPPSSTTTTAQQVNSEWSNYMNASDEIVTVVRNSARDHYRFVNPFLVNTLWFAAAAQCACKVFGPASFNKRLTSSNLDLLKLTIDRFISFWGGMENLQGKLARIETALQNLMSRPDRPERPQQESRQPQQDNRHLAPLDAAGHEATDGPPASALAPLASGVASSYHDTAATGTGATEELMLIVPGGGGSGSAPGGWADPNRWSSFGPGPNWYDFTLPFPPVTGPTYFAAAASADPMDFSPYGLEELLMASMVDSQL
ncbi:putative fungal-specific transcription factor, partial [Staphylotrichum tortipilum]